MLLLTLRGTPTIYYGEELGMRDVPIPPGEVQDPQGLNMPGLNLSRDPARTPMQWDNSEYAGFSPVKPWLRVSNTSKRVNVESQKEDPYSHLALYRRLIELRQSEPSLKWGDYKPLYADGQTLAYIRQAEGEKTFLIVLNLSHRPSYITIPHRKISGTIVLATSSELEGTTVTERMELSGDEGMIIALDNDVRP